ncbi:hypothetical protein CP8484711_2027B, partial [Chlamydia psittaci 84-8471/1]
KTAFTKVAIIIVSLRFISLMPPSHLLIA